MKKVLKATLYIFIILVALMAVVYTWAWKSPSYYTITGTYSAKDSVIPFKDYHLVNDHARPFVVEGKNYVIFGASHTRDPQDPEIKQVEEKWNKLQPTVALIEGRLDFFLPGVMNPVEKLGEGGKVKQLASKNNIPIYNWDLSKEVLARQLQPTFTAEQIALAQILNPYFGQLRFGKPESPENYISEYFKRAAYVGQEKNFQTVADIDRAWKKYFPSAKDWRETSDEYELPGYLSAMLTYTNDLRNRQLVAAVKELLAKNEKVFVICGSSHAVCVEPAFRSTKYEAGSLKTEVSMIKVNNVVAW